MQSDLLYKKIKIQQNIQNAGIRILPIQIIEYIFTKQTSKILQFVEYKINNITN